MLHHVIDAKTPFLQDIRELMNGLATGSSLRVSALTSALTLTQPSDINTRRQHLAQDGGHIHGRWFLTSGSNFRRILNPLWLHFWEGGEEGWVFSWPTRLFTVSNHVQIVWVHISEQCLHWW